MAGLLGGVVSLVDEEILDCFERGVTFLETADNGGEDLLQWLRPWLTLGDVLGAVL